MFRPLFQSLFSVILIPEIFARGGDWTMPEPRFEVISLQKIVVFDRFCPLNSIPEANKPRLSNAVFTPPLIVFSAILIFEEGPLIFS